MADQLRRCSPSGAQALLRAPRRASVLQKRASSCPNALTAPFPSLAFSARSAVSAAAPPLPTARRRRRARSPPRKRVAQSISSLAVVFSTLSTSPSVQSSLGKDERVVFFHRRRGCSCRRWRSMRPAVLAPLTSLLYLALGPRSAAEARRVTVRGYNAVVSPEPAMPRPCAAIARCQPCSHSTSFN